ncbi:mechanosensitive ion channel domain-containing protein [Candidatus Albibeggiatoa sp. nov. NOAA]|uniref:mechanosensitive ion channel domain-containing protein n=1 Tax=Candidatus Albibeggiatoa sp. nov. NOAA TaxID=3162724 RepID=UPI0032F267B4|nr:mechanosensitive ion channel [Thiotrichaceae bacterium]
MLLIQRTFYLFVLAFFLSAATLSLDSQVETQLLIQKQALLEDEKQSLVAVDEALTKAQADFSQQKQALPELEITETSIIDIDLEREKLQIELENLQLKYKARQSQLSESKQYLETFKSQKGLILSDEEKLKLEQNIELQSKQVEVDQLLAEFLIARVIIMEKLLEVMTAWSEMLNNTYLLRQQLDKTAKAKLKQQHYLEQAVNLKKTLSISNVADKVLLEAQILDNEALADEVVNNLKIDQIKQQLQLWQQEITTSKISQMPILQAEKLLSERLAQLAISENNINDLSKLFDNKLQLNKRSQDNLRKRSETWKGRLKKHYKKADEILQQIQQRLSEQRETTTILTLEANTFKQVLTANYKTVLHQKLVQRRQFLQTSATIDELSQAAAQLPDLFTKSLVILKNQLYMALEALSMFQVLLLIFCLQMWVLGLAKLKMVLNRISGYLTQLLVVTFIASLGLVLVNLVKRNLLSIAIIGSLGICLYFMQLPEQTHYFLLTLMLIVLGAQLSVHLAFLLFSPYFAVLPRYQNAYLQIKWIARVLAIAALITTLAHRWQISPLALEIIDTGFMVLLSIAILPAMNMRYFLLYLLEQSAIQSYWLFAIRVITLLVPLLFLSVALLGIIGYINLGWIVAQQAYWLIFVLVFWLIVQGLLRDLMYILKNFMMQRSQYGLLWTQDIIPLGHNLLNIGLFVFSLMLLSWLNHWHDDLAFTGVRRFLFDDQFIQIGRTHTSLASVVFSILGLLGIFWLGSWTKRITYRWIYANIRDLGIRNSLSVFTQYFVVLVGLLVILQVLGIDLTTMTVFAGALGVGIGFGLQNIANNFISGILLLIERPLKTGDYVNIGGVHEGEVTRIGIRSLTVQAWNHQEVVVPNAEIISSAFTNWTLTNTIMRTTLHFRVGYDCDPHFVRNLLLEKVEQVPEILEDPEPMVNLWEFSEYAIIFRVDYYIDIKEHGTFKMRTKVNFLVWDELKKAGINMPYPQHDIRVKQSIDPVTEMPQDYVSDLQLDNNNNLLGG